MKAPKYIFFSDSRFSVDESRQVFTDVRHFSGDGWRRDLADTIDLGIVGRVSPAVASDSMSQTSVPFIYELPNYVGLVGLLRSLPRIIGVIFRAVREAEVVIVRLPGAVGLVAAAFAVFMRKPIAAEVVGDIEDVIRSGATGWLLELALAPVVSLNRWVIKRCGVVRYMTRRTLQQKFPASTSALSIGCSSVQLDSDWLAHRWEPRTATETRWTLITVGSQEQHYKGHSYLIRAVRELVNNGYDVSLRLVGDGRLNGTLRELARSLSLEDRVLFEGYVSDRLSLASKLQSSDVFVLPSLTEGMPRSLIEAMAIGMPAVGSQVGGVVELLPQTRRFAPADATACANAICSLIDESASHHIISEQNRTIALNYSAEALDPLREQWSVGVARLGNAGKLGPR